MKTNLSNYQSCFDLQIYRDRAIKQRIRARFDELAEQRHYWQEKSSYYYKQQYNYYRFLIPEKAKVLGTWLWIRRFTSCTETLRWSRC